MENLNIQATQRTPEVDFNFEKSIFFLRGESYPEDVTSFYGPVISQLREHLASREGVEISFGFELIYFNSSTAKILFGLFENLDEAASAGNKVNITWAFEEDDDNMEEMGAEFAEDLEHADFQLKQLKG